MYVEHGPDCVRQLNGMFAFLLYDRDRAASCWPRAITSASSRCTTRDRRPARAVRLRDQGAAAAPRGVARRRTPRRCSDYLTFQFVLGDATLFRGVRKLLPGHYQVVDLDHGCRSAPCSTGSRASRLDPYHTEEYFVERGAPAAGRRRAAADAQRRAGRDAT